jgi:hypothetical protein
MRIRYDRIVGVEMQRRGRVGRLVVNTTCAGAPFTLDFRRSQNGRVVVAAHELAARCLRIAHPD